MSIKELFKKPIDRNIHGVVTIGNEDEEQKWMELEEYVCTEEITKQFRVFFKRYRESLTQPTEKIAAWITGFFGSGKSHFLKILGYILENEVVAGVKAVDYFNDKIKDEMILADMKKCAEANNKVVLFNIDAKAKSDSKNKDRAIVDIMLRAFNESIGYCGEKPWVAGLERTLDDEGLLDEFIQEYEEHSGRNWKASRAKAVLNKKYIVDAIAKVWDIPLEDAIAHFNEAWKDEAIEPDGFAKLVDKYSKTHNKRVIFLMDEVGQFVGDNTNLMLNLQTCVEELGLHCKGRAWVVITSQQELKAMLESTKDKQQDFSKIQARFDTRILLSGAEAGEVIKKRILEKKDQYVNSLKSLFETNSNKINNLIIFDGSPTWSGYKTAEEFKDVYPFAPYQFALLQKVFTSIREHGMSEGKHLAHSERSLLSAFQDSAVKFGDENENVLIPFDIFYITIEQFIDYDIKNVFTLAKNNPALDEFDIRVLEILFMILHVKEMPSNLNRLTTLMVGSINEDKLSLKKKISESLERLEKETLIQRNGDEYEFLTNTEQDVNKQINHTDYNEGEIKRNIQGIIYENILENNKFRYKGRYDFSLNRYVDDELKGINGQDNITIKFITDFSGIQDPTGLAAESSRSGALVIDLTNGSFIDELIRANRISVFRRNNSASMTAAMVEIMEKKSREASERLKRAEDNIREKLENASIYFNGSLLDLEHKGGKERVLEALGKVVEQEYYDLGYVSYFYQDQKSIMEVLNENNGGLLDNDLRDDANFKAYQEIFEKIKNNKMLSKATTVKSLLDFFAKKPYGWRELDVLGMIAKLFKVGQIQITIHGVPVEENDYGFKLNLSKKNEIDTMVVKKQEKISEDVLYQVKKIMNDVYGLNLEMKEVEMKKDILAFFEKKKEFLDDLKSTYNNDFAGVSGVAPIREDITAILATKDTVTIFDEIIKRRNSLDEHASLLEQLENFYKKDSSQKKVYEEAKEIVQWYTDNSLFDFEVASLKDVVDKMNEILKLEVPFARMYELSQLVMQAGNIKDQILEEKFQKAIESLENDRKEIEKEMQGVLDSDLPEELKAKIQNKYDLVEVFYQDSKTKMSKESNNLDKYINSSQLQVRDFKKCIENTIQEDKDSNKPLKTKKIKVIECIPAAKKNIKSKEDIDNVIEFIRKSLEDALQDNDEVTLD